jgi:hypothetical protein
MLDRARGLQGLFGLTVLSAFGSACVTEEVQQQDPSAPEMQATGRLCTATLAIKGTFMPGAPDPDPGNMGGCWPVGTWTFSAAMGQSTCMTAPTLESQYAFTDVRDAENVDTITYVNNPSDDHVRIKVNAGDGGLCVGIIDIFSADGKGVTTLRPALQSDNSLNGTGEYDLYDSDQFTQ